MDVVRNCQTIRRARRKYDGKKGSAIDLGSSFYLSMQTATLHNQDSKIGASDLVDVTELCPVRS
jgi:hypothetical protein